MAKKAAPGGDVIDVGDSLEITETREEGTTLVGFIKNIVPFFQTARMIETAALERLNEAKALKAPESEADDLAIQERIKRSTILIKEAEGHWTATSAFFNFHKRLVAHRDRVVGEATKSRNAGSLIQAREIEQALHNRYAEAERRRAAEEQERQRLAEEARQREAQEAEARRHEAEAAAKEIASPDLSEREVMFVDYVFGGMLPTAAAKRCSYKDPELMADRLMKLPKIKKAISAKEEAKVAREQAQAIREKPVQVEVAPVRPAIAKPSAGAYDRTTWGAEVLDADRLGIAVIAAIRDEPSEVPRGIAIEILKAGMRSPQVATIVRDYGVSLHEKIDRWPGVRHTKKTTTV